MNKIVILDGYTENPGDLSWSGFEQLGEVTLYERTPEDQIVSRIGNAEIVITNKTPIGADVLTACPSIKYIGVLATGYNVVDIHAAKARDIVVANIPTYGTTAVAQYVFALLLEVCHHVADHSRAVYEGAWSRCPDFCFWNTPLIELAGKTLGIIGLGRIGQNTAKIAQAFGMQVLAFDDYQSEDGAKVAKYVALDELLAQSDVISLHCPLMPQTQGIINANNIAKMKDNVIIINTSRGPLIDEQALAQALNTGKVYAAGLDVVSTEPIAPDNQLLTAKNCLITPHIAWAPKESRQRLMDIAVSNLRGFLKGEIVNRVN